LHAVGCKARDLLPAFKVQELTIISWAFSRLGARHDEFFGATARRLIDSESFRQCVHAQGAANMLWAFERQQELGSAVSSELAQATHAMVPHCLQMLPRLKPQEVTSILHAIMRTGLRWRQCPTVDQLFTSAASHIQLCVDQFSGPQVLNLLVSFAGFAPSGCAAPEFCIALQHCLVAACRAKSLESTDMEKLGHACNLLQTALSENRIQCEETETLNSHTVLDANQDGEARARAVGCNGGSTMRPARDNQVCASQPGNHCAVIDTEKVHSQLQARTPQSAMPTGCQFGDGTWLYLKTSSWGVIMHQ